MLAIELPEDIERRLEALAKATGRPTMTFIHEAILEHLDDFEDVYLAERELTEVRAGRSRAVPLAELMTRYGVDGLPD